MTATQKYNAKLMRSAGFRHVYEGVWMRGDIRIAVGFDQKMGLRRLVKYIIDNSVYWARRNASIKYEEFKIEN